MSSKGTEGTEGTAMISAIQVDSDRIISLAVQQFVLTADEEFVI